MARFEVFREIESDSATNGADVFQRSLQLGTTHEQLNLNMTKQLVLLRRQRERIIGDVSFARNGQWQDKTNEAAIP
ncbi:MAG: hypothetical protein ABL888_04780 [Pirellulaceae bacterium]